MPTSYYSMTIRDWSKETQSHKFPVTEVTAANLPGLLVAGGNYETAVQNVIVGVEMKKKLVAFENLNVALPTDPTAQREQAWVVHYHDSEEYFDAPTNSIYNENYGKPETVRLACPNTTDATLRQPNSDLADLSEARWVAFIAAFQAFALSRGGGNVTVDFIELSRGQA